MSPRNEELFAIEAIAKELGGSWRPGEDPPDFYLTIDGREVAIEVSLLTQHVQDAQRGWISRRGDDMASLRLLDELNEELNAELPGDCTVMLTIHAPIHNLRTFKSELASELKRIAQESPNPNLTLVIQQNEVGVTILRGRVGSKKVIGAVPHRNSSPDILSNARDILMDRVVAKFHKCSRIEGPIWLALLNDYFLADVDTYRQAWSLDVVEHRFERILFVSEIGAVSELDSTA